MNGMEHCGDRVVVIEHGTWPLHIRVSLLEGSEHTKYLEPGCSNLIIKLLVVWYHCQGNRGIAAS